MSYFKHSDSSKDKAGTIVRKKGKQQDTSIEAEGNLQELTGESTRSKHFPLSKSGFRMTEISQQPHQEGVFGEEKQEEYEY